MLTRRLDEAREAYKKKDLDAARRAHLPTQNDAGRVESVAMEHHMTVRGKYLKSVVYGGLDGTITTFAAVAGVAGAALSPGIVLIMGVANLMADGLSMSIGDYLSSKSESEYEAAERKREAWEVENYPEGEKKELSEIYHQRGMNEKDADAVVEIFAKDKNAWVDTMMVEELGILPSDDSPVKSAVATFSAFVLFGFLPVAAYVFGLFVPSIDAIRFPLACFLTGATLFGLGALKTTMTGRNWFTSGLEMLLVGGIAAGAAYLVGMLLGGLAK
jgi:VIT1/CCC1 family predicted Fe2+/Mn2+ transporter